MNSRDKVARWLVGLGCFVLLASAVLHCLAYVKISSPAVAASNLPAAMQSVFTVAFLSMAWTWIVMAIIAWLAAFQETRLRKAVVLICGFAVLLQAIFTLPFVGLFIGNEMIGAASILMIAGGFTFASARSRVEVPAD
ncbi:MAG TPA: hypothetical protein VFW94_03665 [Candidatus Acidoferrales bacterium]|nr:hypothetical protein [Candidatus Acidoferrales bacterium]